MSAGRAVAEAAPSELMKLLICDWCWRTEMSRLPPQLCSGCGAKMRVAATVAADSSPAWQ